jgi:hypothetical protein
MAGTIIADTWQNGDGTQNYKCRAWVNFNGDGTVAIRASGNVSSITDLGTGLYRANFTTALVDASFSIVGSCKNSNNTTYNSGNENTQFIPNTPTTTSIQMGTGGDGSLSDCELVFLTVFR